MKAPQDNQKKKETIIASLQSLQEHVGWKVIVKVLEENIRETEAKLHGESKLEEGETIELLQRQRIDRIRLGSLPKDLIEEYSEKETFPVELDPYN